MVFGLSVERNLLISLLKLTKDGATLIKDVNVDARLPSTVCIKLLQKMQNEKLVYLDGDKVEVDTENRLKIAVKAASLGADIQNISDMLKWQEFEEIAAIALKTNGYIVKKNVRFKHGDRRYEIDVVGCRKPLVVCIDCKRWQHAIAASALRKIVEEQIQRTEALADTLPNLTLDLECTKWEKTKFLPAVLSLVPGAYKFYYEVPVVPVLSLQDFIGQLPLYLDTMKCFPKKFSTLSSNS
jgi:Holliday junction resolvase-like predicted endonuclease